LISAKKNDGSYLSFIPANKINSELKFRLDDANANHFRVGGSYVFQQNHPSEFETRTADYLLMYFGASATLKNMKWSLTCNNLLNKTYYDHLSRFKYYGIYNTGRSVIIGVTIPL
jgi:iron complex outermembrane receptor protein